MKPDERGFEDAITASLVEAGGYRVCKWGTKPEWAGDFDPKLGLDTAELLAFIAETQPAAWKRLLEVHGGPDGVLQQFGDRLAKQLDERGAVDVLRHGVNDHGIEVRLAFFKPAHGLTPELTERYLANRLTVTRQLPYEAGGHEDPRPVPVRQRHPGRDGGAEEPAHPPDRRAREEAVPRGPRPGERDPRASGARPLRRGPEPRRDDDQARGAQDPLPALQPWRRGRQGQRPRPDRPPDPLPVGGDLGAGRVARPPGPLRPRRARARGRPTRRSSRPARSSSPATTSGTPSAGSRRPPAPRAPATRTSSSTRRARARATPSPGSPTGSCRSTGPTTSPSSTRSSSSPTGSSSTASSRRRSTSSSMRPASSPASTRTAPSSRQPSPASRAGSSSRRSRSSPSSSTRSPTSGSAASRSSWTRPTPRRPARPPRTSRRRWARRPPRRSSRLPRVPRQRTCPADPQDALAANVAARGRQPNLSFFAFTATPKARTLELFGRQGPRRQLRALPPLLDAPGHRGGLHPRRARQLHDLRDLLEGRQGGRRRSRVRHPQGAARHRPLRLPPPPQPRPEGRGHRRALPRAHPPQDRRAGARRWWSPRRASTPSATSRPSTPTSPSKGYADTKALVAFSGQGRRRRPRVHRVGHERLPREPDRDALRRARVRRPHRGREVPDRLRPAAAAHDVRGQDARRARRRPDPLAAQPDPPREDRHVRPRLPQRGRRHHRGVQALVRDDGRHPDRPEPPLRPRRPAPRPSRSSTTPRHGRSRRSSRTAPRRSATTAWSTRLLAPAVERFKAKTAEEQDEVRDALDQYVRAYSFLSQVVDFGDVGARGPLPREPSPDRPAAVGRRRSARPRIRGGADPPAPREDERGRHHPRPRRRASSQAIYSGEGKEAEEEKEHLSTIIEVLNERFGLLLGTADQLFFDQMEATWLADEQLARPGPRQPHRELPARLRRRFIKGIVGRMDDNADIFRQDPRRPEHSRQW